MGVQVGDDKTISESWAEFCQLETIHIAVQKLAEASRKTELSPNEILIEQGSNSDAVYLVVSGRLKIVLYTENGHEIWLSDAEAGDMLGEISALADVERTSSIVSVDTSVVLSVQKFVFLSIAEEYGAVSMAVGRLLAQRLAATSAQMSELVAMPVAARLHAELIRIGSKDERDDERFEVHEPTSVSELGQRIHATREATSRALTQLERRGLVHRGTDLLTVILPKF
jgi:CRP-like cAMP-binding protein